MRSIWFVFCPNGMRRILFGQVLHFVSIFHFDFSIIGNDFLRKKAGFICNVEKRKVNLEIINQLIGCFSSGDCYDI